MRQAYIGENWIQTRTRYNESSSFSNNLMKRESFRASRGMGKMNIERIEFIEDKDCIKTRTRYNEPSSFANNYNETSKLPRSAQEGGNLIKSNN